MRRHGSTVSSLDHARMVLSLLEAGRARAIKRMRNDGKPEIVVCSEVPPAFKTKIRGDFAHVFENFFAAHGAGDGLFPGTSQTAKRREVP
jgi:hypothetical protein